MEPIVSSETSAIRTQTPGNYPKGNKLHNAGIFYPYATLSKMLKVSTKSGRRLCVGNIFHFKLLRAHISIHFGTESLHFKLL